MLLTYFLRITTIYCGGRTDGANAYFLGKIVFEVGKYPLFRLQDDLMNRVIHRSWGEGLWALIYRTHHAKRLWISEVSTCQPLSLGIRKAFRP
jgi:hypothetical protein